MLTTSKVNNIRRKHDKLFESTLKILRGGIDKYEHSNMQEIGYLKSYQAQLEDGWRRFLLFQNELYELDEDDIAQELEAFETYLSLATRIRELMEGKRFSTPPTPKCSSNPSNYFQGSNNNSNKTNAIQTPTTENIAPTRMPILSHDARSSTHDTHNVSTTRNLTTTLAASASQ